MSKDSTGRESGGVEQDLSAVAKSVMMESKQIQSILTALKEITLAALKAEPENVMLAEIELGKIDSQLWDIVTMLGE